MPMWQSCASGSLVMSDLLGVPALRRANMGYHGRNQFFTLYFKDGVKAMAGTECAEVLKAHPDRLAKL